MNPNSRYCYHCRIYHPAEEMRLVFSKNSKRWRCLKTIAAAQKPVADRDKFGEIVRAINKEISETVKRRRACYEF